MKAFIALFALALAVAACGTPTKTYLYPPSEATEGGNSGSSGMGNGASHK